MKIKSRFRKNYFNARQIILMISKYTVHYMKSKLHANGYTYFFYISSIFFLRITLLSCHVLVNSISSSIKNKIDGKRYRIVLNDFFFQIRRITVRCKRSGIRSSVQNLLFESFFLLERGKEVALSNRLSFTTGIKGWLLRIKESDCSPCA